MTSRDFSGPLHFDAGQGVGGSARSGVPVKGEVRQGGGPAALP